MGGEPMLSNGVVASMISFLTGLGIAFREIKIHGRQNGQPENKVQHAPLLLPAREDDRSEDTQGHFINAKYACFLCALLIVFNILGVLSGIDNTSLAIIQVSCILTLMLPAAIDFANRLPDSKEPFFVDFDPTFSRDIDGKLCLDRPNDPA